MKSGRRKRTPEESSQQCGHVVTSTLAEPTQTCIEMIQPGPGEFCPFPETFIRSLSHSTCRGLRILLICITVVNDRAHVAEIDMT